MIENPSTQEPSFHCMRAEKSCTDNLGEPNLEPLIVSSQHRTRTANHFQSNNEKKNIIFIQIYFLPVKTYNNDTKKTKITSKSTIPVSIPIRE